jgi:phosphotransferase system HPr-like phosphotransfer protein
MGIMGIGLDVDKVITIEAEGEDAAEAILAVDNFLTK